MHAYLFQTFANCLNSRWQPSPITKHACELQMVEIKAKLIHAVLNQAEWTSTSILTPGGLHVVMSRRRGSWSPFSVPHTYQHRCNWGPWKPATFQKRDFYKWQRHLNKSQSQTNRKTLTLWELSTWLVFFWFPRQSQVFLKGQDCVPVQMCINKKPLFANLQFCTRDTAERVVAQGGSGALPAVGPCHQFPLGYIRA